MTTIVKFLIAAALSFLLSSCQFGSIMGVSGNGNVQTEKRTSSVSGGFTSVKASNGLDVYIRQDKSHSITVEADENLLDIIHTEVRGDKLHIYTDKNIGTSKSKKVYVSAPEIEAIASSSGADIFVEDLLQANKLELKSSSGSAIRLETEADYISCDTSSGSGIRIKGRANSMHARASSGSSIKAGELEVAKCDAKASSGGDIYLHVTKDLVASASSGGDIRYSGNPQSVSTGKSVSGSVRKN
ncbi:head GIN domain-containing protein [Sinomicrobium sp. M5D2P9]